MSKALISIGIILLRCSKKRGLRLFLPIPAAGTIGFGKIQWIHKKIYIKQSDIAKKNVSI